MSLPKGQRYFVNKLLNAPELTCTFNSDYWKSKIVEHVEKIRTEVPPRMEFCDGGIYTGSPGIAYLFYCIIKSPLMESRKKEYISKGIEYVLTAEQYIKKKYIKDYIELHGFLVGKTGFHAIAAALYSISGSQVKSERHLRKFVKDYPYCLKHVSYGGSEFFVGRAGYLLGALWLSKQLNKPVIPAEKINAICDLMIREGRAYGQDRPVRLIYSYYTTEYIGAAHGLGSILFALLCCEEYLASNPEAEEDIRSSVDAILAMQTSNGNFPTSLNHNYEHYPGEDNELVHWCHGAPGMVYMMAKAYLRWKDEKYLDSCRKAADLVWQRGLLTKGPGLCHGVAGNGYVFLLMYRLTGDEKYLKKAVAFAEFISTPEFRKNSKKPDSLYSLFEGIAGTICFLLDVHNPSQAAFPFMDVF